MAQFIKCFSRKLSFSSHNDSSNRSIDSSNSSIDDDVKCIDSNSNSNSSNKSIGSNVYVTDRLINRAKLIKKHLIANKSIDIVSPLGNTLFGLDVLTDK
jgi:hypothetical protein